MRAFQRPGAVSGDGQQRVAIGYPATAESRNRRPRRQAQWRVDSLARNRVYRQA